MVGRVQLKFTSITAADRFMSTIESYCPWMSKVGPSSAVPPAKHSPKSIGSVRTAVRLPYDPVLSTPTRERVQVYRDQQGTPKLVQTTTPSVRVSHESRRRAERSLMFVVEGPVDGAQVASASNARARDSSKGEET